MKAPTSQEQGNLRSSASRASLFVAVLCAGLMAGLFLLYTHTVMPGLGATDDQTFVGAFQEIDRSVENNFVRATFFGGIILTAATILLDRRRPMLWWVGAALALSLVTVAITAAVNVPLNNEIKAAGDPQVIDVALARANFGEDWWNAWNLVRCVTSTATFGLLTWALVLYERADNAKSEPQPSTN